MADSANQATKISPSDPPFIQIECVFNFRSVGGKTLRVKPNLLFRCGEISTITPTGAQALSSLNVTTIFDLRDKNEAERFPSKSPSLEHMKIVPTPVDQHIDFGPETMATVLKKFEANELNAFMDTYRDFLTKFGPALEAAIRHIIDDPGHLQSSTAQVTGKDRTGILVAIILLVCVDENDIAEEYALTEIGLLPVYDKLAARFTKLEAFRNNPIGAQNLGSSRKQTMVAAIKMLDEKYGGAEQYVLQTTNFTKEDIEELRKKALVSA
ncbi:hypothetical protein AN958_11086 [Leucoagaricus sp. SymC.cos]|nr:hypothetical protein AN958_11086 [Leucoagaricus sp. SymC.cos]